MNVGLGIHLIAIAISVVYAINETRKTLNPNIKHLGLVNTRTIIRNIILGWLMVIISVVLLFIFYL